jgi:hypothetical protein
MGVLDTSWSRKFDEPIPLPRGRELVTPHPQRLRQPA